MRKITFPMFATFIAIYLISGTKAITSSGGAPAGHSGSPASNSNTCATSCHTGTAIVNQDFTINSNIPPTGFLPNTTYTFTVQANTNGSTGARIGFMASVEHNDVHVGTLIAHAQGGSQASGPNFLTHTTNSSLPSGGQRIWFFDWNSGQAPAATIYLAVNFCNANGTSSGDATKTRSLSFVKSSLSIENIAVNQLKMYPNPVLSELSVQFFAHEAGELTIRVFDVSGRVQKNLYNDFIPTGNFEEKFDWSQLSPGSYLLQINLNGQQYLNQVLKM